MIELIRSHGSYNKLMFLFYCNRFKRNYQYRLFRPWFKNDWLFHLTAMGRDNPKFVKGINNFSNTVYSIKPFLIKKLIEHRRQFLDNERKVESQLPALKPDVSNAKSSKLKQLKI